MLLAKKDDIFEILIANLDSNPNKYVTLYDLFRDYNYITKSKVVFPAEALELINIKKS